MASASEIYQRTIVQLAAEATGHGVLAAPTARAFLDNPLCGDCVEMQLGLRDGRIDALAHQVKGCLLCRAAAAIIGKHAPGAALPDIERISAGVDALLESKALAPGLWPELDVFSPVHGHPSRYRCVRLPFEAVLAALRNVEP